MIAVIQLSQTAIEQAIRSHLEACGHKTNSVKLKITPPSSDGPIHSPGHVSAEASIALSQKPATVYRSPLEAMFGFTGDSDPNPPIRPNGNGRSA